MRYSALRAWAVNDSPRASTEAVRPRTEAPSAEQLMIDERFWKSYTPAARETRGTGGRQHVVRAGAVAQGLGSSGP